MFTQDQIIDDLIGVMRSNQIRFDEKLIRSRSNEIVLCIMALLHNTPLQIRNRKTGKCRIHARHMEKMTLRYLEKGKDNEVILPKEEWGLLSVWGFVPMEFQNPQKNLEIAFELFTSSLLAETYCDESMFYTYREGEPEDERMTIYQELIFETSLVVSEEFELIAVPTKE